MTQNTQKISATKDRLYMELALRLARRVLGRVAPNPAVGCLLVRDDMIVGRGATQAGGRPHAETQALTQAGTLAKGATAYVTLEPCAHEGETPACVQALIKAKLARIVIAHRDPDPRTNGKSIAILRAAGLDVVENVMADEAQRLNLGFLLRIHKGRPMVTLKIATSKNGMMRVPQSTQKSTQIEDAQEKWITGTAARQRAHLMRATHDAILVGMETALIDNPKLDCRLSGMAAYSPQPFIASRKRALPNSYHLHGKAQILTHATPASMLAALGKQGITRVLLEGGAQLAKAFLEADLVDAINWFCAPHDLADNGESDMAFMGLANMANRHEPHSKTFQLIGEENWDKDKLTLWQRKDLHGLLPSAR
ncbi:MAG: bifunctional diaminohydroxyphosphoribosylaminopyrimidine deaminase/5-amino-6-(5-phosphoribosylamino)uracil reductase RibD [Alphaproteobacteria bacterium]|nr:bifunctional diaminohydroxyphosphoribosylaminopyrimidine deaminase/5-amino-6-(5-phosphoribosylamino)uracil reductase RibD [Alphaproteobacteria bacterium]